MNLDSLINLMTNELEVEEREEGKAWSDEDDSSS
jgi:hypothetical protein